MKQLTAVVIIVGVVVLSVSYYERITSHIRSSSDVLSFQQLRKLQTRTALYKLYADKSSSDKAVKSLQNASFRTYKNSNASNQLHNDIKSSTSDNEVSAWFPGLISLEEVEQNDDNVFFIETSCGTAGLMKTNSNSGTVHLNARQCCAVESVALTNSKRSVHVLHTCPLDAAIYERSPEYVKRTLAQPNVRIVYLKVDELIEGSPVQALYRTKKIGSSRFPVEHLSDVLRFLTLWKYGGTYMDFDTITIRQLDGLGYNYAGRPTRRLVASGVINFRHSGVGHAFVTDILKELNNKFDGSIWAKNGPGAITRMILRTCNVKNITQLETEKCDIFTVYPPKYFYPIYYIGYKSLFGEMSEKKMERLFKDSYNIHFWNRVSKSAVIEVGSNQVYGLLADKYCPSVYHSCGKYF